jgi:hypothetical protein
MAQFYGNLSILSCNSCDSVCAGPDLTGQPIETSEHYEIQTVVNISSIPKPKKCYWPPWVDVQYRRTSDMRPVRQTVKRDNKLPVCQSLPIVSVSVSVSNIYQPPGYTRGVGELQLLLTCQNFHWKNWMSL